MVEVAAAAQDVALSSANSSTVVLALAIVLFTAWYFYTLLPPPNFPPGPMGLPFVGYVPFMEQKTYQALTTLAGKYGDIYSIRMGSQLMVILNGIDILQEAFVKKSTTFAAKPPLFVINRAFKGMGVNFAHGASWVEQRKYAFHLLREFGMGKQILDTKILDESEHLNKYLMNLKGAAIDPTHALMAAVSNIILSLTFGKRMDYDDPEYKWIMRAICINFEQARFGLLQDLFPILRWLPLGKKRPGQYFIDNVDELRDYISRRVDKEKATYKPDETRHMVDAYLHKMKTEKNRPGSTFNEDQLVGMVLDMYNAGIHTLMSTMKWCMLYLAVNPETQDKVRAEIDNFLSQGETLSMSKTKETPYTEAMIMETQRCNYIAPLGDLHAPNEDVELRGYKIPKGTMVLANYWSCLMDPKRWPDPYRFDPTRFLDKENNVLKPREFIPFFIGKRSCVGEQLARAELYLMASMLVRHFKVEVGEGPKLHERIIGDFSVNLHPPYHTLKFVPREDITH